MVSRDLRGVLPRRAWCWRADGRPLVDDCAVPLWAHFRAWGRHSGRKCRWPPQRGRSAAAAALLPCASRWGLWRIDGVVRRGRLPKGRPDHAPAATAARVGGRTGAAGGRGLQEGGHRPTLTLSIRCAFAFPRPWPLRNTCRSKRPSLRHWLPKKREGCRSAVGPTPQSNLHGTIPRRHANTWSEGVEEQRQRFLTPVESVPAAAAALAPADTFMTPASPNVRPIMLLHRQHDGYISLHRKHGEQFENLCSVPANMLDGRLCWHRLPRVGHRRCHGHWCSCRRTRPRCDPASIADNAVWAWRLAVLVSEA